MTYHITVLNNRTVYFICCLKSHMNSTYCLVQTNRPQEKAEHLHQFSRAAGHGAFFGWKTRYQQYERIITEKPV